MSEHRDFYDALWGDSTLFRSIANGEKERSPNRQKWFTTTDAALLYVKSMRDQHKFNLYHSCSLFNKKSRTQVCAERIKAFWLDMDLNKTKFNSVAQMSKAYLPRFDKWLLGLDMWVVHTGHGIHVYWMLKDAITKEAWDIVALQLHNFCAESNIIVDTMRTKDSSSLMRVPGTVNYKDDPVDIKLIKRGSVIVPDFSSITETVVKSNTYDNSNLDLNDAVSIKYDNPSDPYIVADKCQVIREFRERGLEGNEPVRRQAISVVRLCINGPEAVHKFFSQHPRYTKKIADDKMVYQDRKGIGPSTCAVLDEMGACSRCPHKGKITSPIQLGVVATPIPNAIGEIKSDAAKSRAQELIKLAPSNKYWLINKNGIYRIVDDIPILVSKVPLYIIDKFSADVRDQSIITVLIRAFTANGPDDFHIPLRFLAEDTKLMGEFYSRSIFPVHKKYFKSYLMSYCDSISHIAPHRAAKALGWQPDKSILYGGRGEGFNAKGEAITSILDPKAATYLEGFEAKGTLEKWSEIIAFWDRERSYEPHLFSVLCSLGAPLLYFTSAKGFVLSLQGHSGCGKTLSHMVASSIWGDPVRAGCIGTDDSVFAMLGRLGVVNNLPMRLDEATALDPRDLSSLVFQLVNGRGRARATADGSLSNSATDWRTITLVSTNSPLLEHNISVISEAARVRILELDVAMPDNMMRGSKRVGEIMEENYGVCGKPFLQYIVKNLDVVRKHLDYYFDMFQKLVADDKRFWVACGAVAFTAATIAQQLKLFTLDTDKMLQWFSTTLKNLSDINEQFIVETRGFQTLDEFMFALKDALEGHIARVNEEGLEISEPPREVLARLRHMGDTSEYLYVRGPVLTEFIQKQFTESVRSVRERLGIAPSTAIRIGNLVGRYYTFKLK